MFKRGKLSSLPYTMLFYYCRPSPIQDYIKWHNQFREIQGLDNSPHPPYPFKKNHYCIIVTNPLYKIKVKMQSNKRSMRLRPSSTPLIYTSIVLNNYCPPLYKFILVTQSIKRNMRLRPPSTLIYTSIVYLHLLHKTTIEELYTKHL